jgi:two-component system phosphate regulon sensor histidine kinase PhoR
VHGLSFVRSRFFWKLYASYALLVLATTAVVGSLVHHQMSRSLLTEVATSLRDKTRLIEPYALRAFDESRPAAIETEIATLGRETGIRITLIRPDGSIVGDSEHDPATMDNHGDRPEVIDAQTRRVGLARRYSHTLQQFMLYAAIAVRRDGQIRGTVRTAMPLREIDARLATMRRTIAAGALIGVLAALLVGIVVARRITAPVAEMTTAAAAMRDGRYEARVRQLPQDEIGILGDALNRLGAELTRRIATMSHDQAQLRAMIAGMVEGVIAVDDHDRVLYSNNAACALLSIDSGGGRGRTLWEVVRLAGLASLVGEARARGEPVHRELAVYRGATELALDAHATAFAVHGAGGVVVVLHDVTDLRRLERIRRDFVANVSHELKTPLTSIKGYLETLLDGALYDEENNLRFLQKIETHVARLADLVRDLLDLAHIESREGSFPLGPVDWRGVVDEAVKRHESALERKGLACVVRGTAEPVIVQGDPGAMTHVIDNLLDNAIKYTPSSGAVSITLDRHGSVGELVVEDTGVGIPEQDRERIFERFYRVDKARSRELGGTGLGLSIVKHCVHAMGGTVHVDSAPEAGSRFIVRLPLSTTRQASLLDEPLGL